MLIFVNTMSAMTIYMYEKGSAAEAQLTLVDEY